MVKPCLEEPPFEELCADIAMDSTTPTIGLIDRIYSEPLDLTPTSSPLLPTTPSHLHAYHESLCDNKGYNPSFDPYCAYLGDLPRKIICSIFFDHTFDFSMTFDEFKRPLTLFASSFLVLSYLHNYDMHAVTDDMLFRALTTSELRTRLLSDMVEWLILLEPLTSILSEA